MGTWIVKLSELSDQTSVFRHDVMRRLVQVIIYFLLIGGFLFIPAGTFNWFYAWIYMALFLLIVVITAFIMPLEVAAERGSKKENMETWDKIVSLPLSLTTLALYLVAGFDFRWGWTPELTTTSHLVGILVFLVGISFNSWAMSANRFYSTVVRIQFDRGHEVCTGGPYRYVRHPGYLGMIVYYMATPVFLGSIWAMIPSLASAILLVIRTGLEDKTLLQKLSGYKEYAAHTRYRLLPGLW